MGHLLRIKKTSTAPCQTITSELGLSHAEESDSALGDFLFFIADDISNNPGNIKPISSDLLGRAKNLVAETTIDLDSPLSHELERRTIKDSN